MKETLLKFARYNQWANEKIVKVIGSEAPELLEKEIASSFNTIKKTLLHMADAEYIWHCRLNNLPFDKVPGRIGAGIDALAEMDKKMIAFIESKDENYFAQSTDYKNLKGEPFTNTNFSILMHVFNHSTFHRGQVVTMLRSGGFSGPIEQTDYIGFARGNEVFY